MRRCEAGLNARRLNAKRQCGMVEGQVGAVDAGHLVHLACGPCSVDAWSWWKKASSRAGAEEWQLEKCAQLHHTCQMERRRYHSMHVGLQWAGMLCSVRIAALSSGWNLLLSFRQAAPRSAGAWFGAASARLATARRRCSCHTAMGSRPRLEVIRGLLRNHGSSEPCDVAVCLLRHLVARPHLRAKTLETISGAGSGHSK